MKLLRKITILMALILCFGLLAGPVAAAAPAAPTVTASNVAQTGKVKLTWNAVDGASKYQVYRATSKTGTYSLMKTTTATSYTNTSAAAGNTYYYKVVAVSAAGVKSPASGIVSRTCDLPRPDVTASNVASSGKIRLTWDAVEGAVSYKVYRSASETGTYTLLKTTTSTAFTNTSAVSGKQYYYKVRAVAANSAANSAYSAVVSRTCDLARPSVTASNVASSGKIRLTWDAVDGAVSYKVYRSTTGKDGSWSLMKTTTSTSYTNTSAQAGTLYYYKVIAIASRSAANSAYSAAVSRTCDLPRPVVSIGLNSSGYPRLTWDKVDGAVSYKVYRAAAGSDSYSLMKTTTGTSYTNTSAKAGITYSYKVIAAGERSAANSAASPVVSITAVPPEIRYVALHQVTIYEAADSSSASFAIPYMTRVQLGKTIYNWDSGSWRELIWQDGLYYVWLPAGVEKFTDEKSSFTYTGSTVFQQEVVDLAAKIALEWDTVYTHGQSKGEMNADGTYGFDCSGFASYLLNTVMQKRIPVYRVTAAIGDLYATGSIVNAGYNGEIAAVDVDMADLQPGDVLFFSLESENDHCGVYLGDGEFAHASRSWENSVNIAPLAGFYGDRLSGIRRYLPEKLIPADTVLQTNGYCKLYALCSSDSEVLRNFAPGEKVTLLYTNNGNWAYVRTDDGTEAFMLVRYLTTV